MFEFDGMFFYVRKQGVYIMFLDGLATEEKKKNYGMEENRRKFYYKRVNNFSLPDYLIRLDISVNSDIHTKNTNERHSLYL